MIRSKIADFIRSDDGLCSNCDDVRGPVWVRTWNIRARRPLTLIVPEIERRCYDCWIDNDIDTNGGETVADD